MNAAQKAAAGLRTIRRHRLTDGCSEEEADHIGEVLDAALMALDELAKRQECVPCCGRGWNVGDCHPREVCGACDGLGTRVPEAERTLARIKEVFDTADREGGENIVEPYRAKPSDKLEDRAARWVMLAEHQTSEVARQAIRARCLFDDCKEETMFCSDHFGAKEAELRQLKDFLNKLNLLLSEFAIEVTLSKVQNTRSKEDATSMERRRKLPVTIVCVFTNGTGSKTFETIEKAVAGIAQMYDGQVKARAKTYQ